jgi:Mg-chelatase subunit ChlD
VVDSEFKKRGFAVLDSGQANSETPAPAQKEKMVPLRIEVPKYSLMGTPVPISHFLVAPNSYVAKSAPPDATRASGQLGWNRGSSPNLEPSSPRANISNEESLAKSDESSANGIIPYASKTIIGGSASGNRNGYIDYRRVTGTGRIVRPGEEGSPEAVEEQRKRSDALSDTDNLIKTGSGTLDVTGSIGAEGSYSSDRRRMSFSGSITSGKRDEEPAPPPLPRPAPSVPRADTDAEANPFSTFSLNVSDAAFRLAAESLRQGRWPTADTLRTEEFVNALTYADPPPAPGEAVSLTQEQARDPFAHNRNLLRLTIQTASAGRDARQPLNLTILLDTSGSMERADRQATLQVALRALAENIQPQDTIGLIGFALTHRLFFQANGLQASQSLREIIGNIPPEGGTNLEQALIAAYAQNRKTATPNTLNRVVLLTDGAANLGDADPASLARLITENKKRGIGLDCYGIGFDDYNDTMLETLARTANGRYAYLNNAEEAREDFAKKLAGALQVAAQNVKVQLEFDPARVSAWRLLGYEKHRLQKEDFRDNTVAAAQLGAAENGTAVYSIALKPDGHGSIGTLRVRYQDPRTGDYRERDWAIPYDPTTPPLEHAASGIQLAASAALFAEKLEALPQAAAVSLKTLEAIVHTANTRQGEMPANRQLHTMLNQAQRLE